MTILFFLLSLYFFTTAQIKFDSLWGIWNDKSKADTSRLIALHKIAKDYLYSKPDSAFYFSQLVYDFAKIKGNKKSMGSALRTQGTSYYIRGDFLKAMEYYNQDLKIEEEVSDKIGIADVLSNIATIYLGLGNYPKAMDYYSPSLKIYEEISSKEGIAGSLNNIGAIYFYEDDYPKALEYYNRGLKISEEISNKDYIAACLVNIGEIYFKQGHFPEALDYYKRSLKIREDLHDKLGIAYVLNDIGLNYQEQSDYPNALNYFNRSLKIREELSALDGTGETLLNIGKLFGIQGNNPKAILWCNKALGIAEEINAIFLQKEACNCLYEAYKVMGNGKRALKYHEKMFSLDDSLHRQETAKKLQQMEFDKLALADSLTREKQKLVVQNAYEKEVSAKEKQRNIYIGIGILVLLFAGGLWNRLRFVRKSRAALQIEKGRSDNLLLNILPEEIANELKEKGHADARDFDMVSILFSDFKSFTQASAKLSAQALVGEVNTCFEAFDAIMEKYGIEKIKTIGDSYMAAGGLPVPTTDSVRNTVLAAIEMQAFIASRKAENDAIGEIAFEMRVGIHTGPVVAGIVGVKKFQYDIWGDTVNTASRIESNGDVGKVNISNATYEFLRHDNSFAFVSRGKIEAKGKGEIDMYFVESVLQHG